MGCIQGLNNGVFGEESRKEGGACESQAAQGQARGGERCEVLYAPHLTNVLFVIKTVNNRARA